MSNRVLPIWGLRDSIVDALRTGNRLVISASTGSGKSTQTPQMLWDAGLSGGKRIVVLQPRRVAARTLAARVAWEMKCPLGGRVGYQVRFEDSISRETEIAFVTEGILLRWLQRDPMLADVGAVLFDEFHERNLLSDVALALVRKLQETHRPDLRLAVMSATLEVDAVARFLSFQGKPAPSVHCETRLFPVQIRWAEYGDERPPWEKAAEAVERLIRSGETGDVLIFMPGMAEIRSTLQELQGARLGERVALIPLHGDLAPEEQDRAFVSYDVRKIIVSTNVAETSVTIDGVRHVVDAGLARVARYDSERGFSSLLVEEISRASADQRAGRAGRTAPGVCWRLWTESNHLNRPAFSTPEIRRSDLSEVVLLLHSLGIRQAGRFEWLDAPETAAVERAEALLRRLGALRPLNSSGDAEPPSGEVGRGESGDLTPVGLRMLKLPMHPRFSRMLIEAERRGCLRAAALAVALVSGRDLLLRVSRDDTQARETREVFEASDRSDFFTLMRAFQFAVNRRFSTEACRRAGIHAQSARMVQETYSQIGQILRRSGFEDPAQLGVEESNRVDVDDERVSAGESEAFARSVLAGFVDQVALRKDRGSLDCELAGGLRGALARESVVQEAKLLVVAGVREVGGRSGVMTLLTLATAIEVGWLREMFPEHWTTRKSHEYDRTHRRVSAIEQQCFLGLVLDQSHAREVLAEAAGECLVDAFSRGWFELPNFDHDARQWISRVNVLNAAVPGLGFPRYDGPGLRRALAKALSGLTLVKEAQALNLSAIFKRQVSDEQRLWVEELTPIAIDWGGAKPVKILYPEPAGGEDDDGDEGERFPEIQVKVLDVLGKNDHPTICEGKVSLKVWLVAPDGKRVASTVDWPAWRQKEYPKLRAALKAKYPGFVWP